MSKFIDFERRDFVPRRDCGVRDFKIRLSFSNDFMVWKVIILQVNPPQVNLPQVNLPQVNLPQVNLPQVNSPKCKLPKCKLPKCNLPAGQSSCRSIFPQVNPPAGQFSQVKLPKCNLPKFNPPWADKFLTCFFSSTNTLRFASENRPVAFNTSLAICFFCFFGRIPLSFFAILSL